MPSTSKEALLLAPVLQFLVQIARNSHLACETTLDAGILDFLLRIYVLFPAFSTSDVENARNKLDLLNTCQTTLLELSKPWDLQDRVVNHPVCVLWTACHPQPPRYSNDIPDDTATGRCIAWRQVEGSYARRRMVVIYKGSLWKANRHHIENSQACEDIIEFMR